MDWTMHYRNLLRQPIKDNGEGAKYRSLTLFESHVSPAERLVNSFRNWIIDRFNDGEITQRQQRNTDLEHDGQTIYLIEYQ